MFTGGVKSLDPQKQMNLPLLTQILEGSVKSIKECGKAELGDKTMIDALEPAVEGLKQSAKENKSLLGGLAAAEKSAKTGVEKTKDYVAKFGRAKTLGERAIGHQDAGATTVWIIFKSIREWVEKASAQE